MRRFSHSSSNGLNAIYFGRIELTDLSGNPCNIALRLALESEAIKIFLVKILDQHDVAIEFVDAVVEYPLTIRRDIETL